MAGNEFPTSVQGNTVVGTVPMALNGVGVAQPLGVVGADKTVHPGITSAGAVIFAAPNGLTTTQVAALTTTQIAALTSGVVVTDVNNTGALTTTVINALTPGNIYDAPVALTVTQLNALSTSTITALTTTQIAALTAGSCIAQVPPIYGALQKINLPIASMLTVVPVAGQTVAAAVTKA